MHADRHTRRPASAHGSALTLYDFFVRLNTTRSEVVAVAFRSKSGRCSRDDHQLIARCWSKLKTKKWEHLYDEYFAVVAEGAREAVKAVNPLMDDAPNGEAHGPESASPRSQPEIH
jgi:hypothetical protein